jgi:hypothetical protein
MIYIPARQNIYAAKCEKYFESAVHSKSVAANVPQVLDLSLLVMFKNGYA